MLSLGGWRGSFLTVPSRDLGKSLVASIMCSSRMPPGGSPVLFFDGITTRQRTADPRFSMAMGTESLRSLSESQLHRGLVEAHQGRRLASVRSNRRNTEGFILRPTLPNPE